MITRQQLSDFLAQYGASLPDFMLDAILAQLESVSMCVDSNYDEAVATLIYAYAGCVIAGSTGIRRVASQHAPSSASQSFTYGDMDFTQLRRALSAIDTLGCTASIVGPDTKTGNFFRVVGC